MDRTCDQFLAGAALARDQHLRRADEVDLLLHFAQCGTLADQVSGAVKT